VTLRHGQVCRSFALPVRLGVGHFFVFDVNGLIISLDRFLLGADRFINFFVLNVNGLISLAGFFLNADRLVNFDLD
jgi:hypothetical protein